MTTQKQEEIAKVFISKARFHIFLSLAMREYKRFFEIDKDNYKNSLEARAKLIESDAERSAFEKEMPSMLANYSKQIEVIAKEVEPQIHSYTKSIGDNNPDDIDVFIRDINFIDSISEMVHLVPPEERHNISSVVMESIVNLKK